MVTLTILMDCDHSMLPICGTYQDLQAVSWQRALLHSAHAG